MVKLLSLQADVSFSPTARSGGSRLENFRSKMKERQSSINAAFEATDRILQKQSQIRFEQDQILSKTAKRIEREQDHLKLVVKEVEKRQAKIEQIGRAVALQHPLISFDLSAIRQIWQKLSLMPAVIKKDLVAIDVKLKGVDQKQQAMRQQALVIQNNGVVIRQNLVVAAQKTDLIQQHANGIKANHQNMEQKAEQMVETKEVVLDQIKKLEERKAERPVLNEAEDVTVESISTWSAIMQKVMSFSAWCFNLVAAAFASGGVDIKKLLAAYRIHSPADAINHPAAWVMIGGMACAIIRKTLFTIACVTVEGALFYYRWKMHSKKEAEQAI